MVNKKVVELLSGMKEVEFLKPVLVKGQPEEKDFQELDRLVREICDANQSLLDSALEEIA